MKKGSKQVSEARAGVALECLLDGRTQRLEVIAQTCGFLNTRLQFQFLKKTQCCRRVRLKSASHLPHVCPPLHEHNLLPRLPTIS